MSGVAANSEPDRRSACAKKPSATVSSRPSSSLCQRARPVSTSSLTPSGCARRVIAPWSMRATVSPASIRGPKVADEEMRSSPRCRLRRGPASTERNVIAAGPRSVDARPRAESPKIATPPVATLMTSPACSANPSGGTGILRPSRSTWAEQLCPERVRPAEGARLSANQLPRATTIRGSASRRTGRPSSQEKRSCHAETGPATGALREAEANRSADADATEAACRSRSASRTRVSKRSSRTSRRRASGRASQALSSRCSSAEIEPSCHFRRISSRRFIGRVPRA